jgi:hypothetical protein
MLIDVPAPCPTMAVAPLVFFFFVVSPWHKLKEVVPSDIRRGCEDAHRNDSSELYKKVQAAQGAQQPIYGVF